MLSSHSQYACGPETQFFTSLSDSELFAAVNDKNWPLLAVDQLSRLSLSGNPVVNLYHISSQDLVEHLQNRLPSAKAMLESLTETFAQHAGKPCWIEKTPDHMLHLYRIRRNYPDSPIIRIIRDPRDAVLSSTKLPWWSDSYLSNCQRWEDRWAATDDFFNTDLLSCTIRYEDLVRQVKETLQALTEFLGISFEPAMLDYERNADKVITDAEPWKKSVTKAISTDRLSVWKRELSIDEATAAEAICHDSIAAFSYERRIESVRNLAIYPFDYQWLEDHTNIIIEAAKKGVRFTGYNPVIHSNYAIGAIPDLGATLFTRLSKTAAFLWRLLSLAVSLNRIKYVDYGKPKGRLEHLCDMATRLLGEKVSFR